MGNSVSEVQAASSSGSVMPDSIKAGVVASSSSIGASDSIMVHSLGDLKKKSPKVYRAVIEGIAMNICNKMKEHQEKLKELMSEVSRR